MPTYELEQSTCEKEGVDSRGILAFIRRLKERDIHLHTFTMARHGKLIAQVNAFPYKNTCRHVENSVTKTFTCVAVGILHDRGLLRLDEPVHPYFSNPSYAENGLGTLTIRHLLTMAMGQDGPDMFAAGDDSRDWCESIFDRRVTNLPGSRFYYNSMASHMLSAIVTKITGKSQCGFLKENYFELCGIQDYDWLEDPSGYSIGGVGLYMKGTDLIKLGQLFLNRGVLNGHRILSEEWCALAASKQIDTAPGYPAYKTESTQGYGFQLWRCTHNGYRASGLFGQMCVVLPDCDTTFVMNSSTAGSQPLLDTFFETVYPCIGNEPLKECPENVQRILELSHILDAQPVTGNAIPAYQDSINGRKIRFRDADKYIRLTFLSDDCSFEIGEGDRTFSCCLGKQEYRAGATDLDQYLMRYGSYMQTAKPRSHAPSAYGSYAWLGASHMRIRVLLNDHTSYNEWDIYFDSYMARLDENFKYLIEGYDYHTQNILLMP